MHDFSSDSTKMVYAFLMQDEVEMEVEGQAVSNKHVDMII
jgi:hypothetical protein